MSRSIFACRSCNEPLGVRHHSGQLHVRPGVTVYANSEGKAGPFIRLVCPKCHRHRDYHDGRVVIGGTVVIADGDGASEPG
jgi:hypothetical protein